MHFLFEEGVIVDMKVVCPQDVKKMLKGPAKEVDGKRWATKHECEEFQKRRCGKEPLKALLARTINPKWTTKHAIDAKKPIVEEGSTQKRLCDIGSSDGSDPMHGWVLWPH